MSRPATAAAILAAVLRGMAPLRVDTAATTSDAGKPEKGRVLGGGSVARDIRAALSVQCEPAHLVNGTVTHDTN
jgi:hypothetical protein